MNRLRARGHGDAVLYAAILGLGLASAIGVLRALLTLDLHVPFDLNEGWNAYHAANAVSGEPLYPTAGGFLFNNYPPLSFYLVGALGLLTHDNILAGRIIALAAFLATGAGIVAVARILGASRGAGLFGALFFMAVIAFDTNRVGMNDPQLLGHALGIAGLWLGLRSNRSSGAMAAAALLLSLAVFTKHNLVIQPVALFLWLALTDRPAAVRLAGSGLLFAAAGAGLFQALYDRSVWAQINSPRLFRWADLWDGLTGWLLVCGAPIAASLATLRLRDRQALFCLLYLAVSLAIGLWFEGGSGTSSNVLCDNLIALALCAAVGWDRLARQMRPAWSAALFAACFALPVAGMLAVRALNNDFNPRFWLDRQDPAVREAASDIALIRAQPGPVLCADQALCYWAGKSAQLDEWGMNQAILTRTRNLGEFVAAIASRRYALIVVDPFHDIYYPALWQAPSLEAVRANYRLSHSDTYGSFWIRP